MRYFSETNLAYYNSGNYIHDVELKVNGNGMTNKILTNNDIVSESLKITQTLSDSNSLVYGKVCPATFYVKIFDTAHKYKGCIVNVAVVIKDQNGTEITRHKLGTYKIDTDYRTSDRQYKELKGYDLLYTLGKTSYLKKWKAYSRTAKTKANRKNVATLFTELLTNTTDNSGICQKIGCTYNTTVFNSLKKFPVMNNKVAGNSSLTAISYLDMLQYFCEILGLFCYLDFNGELRFTNMYEPILSFSTKANTDGSTTDELERANIYNSSTEIWDSDGSRKLVLSPSNYYQNGFSFEDYTTSVIKTLTIQAELEDGSKSDDNMTEYTYTNPDISSGKEYVIKNNILTKGWSETLLDEILTSFVWNANYENITFHPSKLKTWYHPQAELGDFVTATTLEGDTITFPILKRTIEGCSSIKDTYEANGKESEAKVSTSLSSSSQTEVGYAQVDLSNIMGASIQNSMIADSTITNSKIVDGTIEGTKIKNATITNSNFADGTIENSKIKNGTIEGSKIKDATITGGKIANATIERANITDATINAISLEAKTAVINDLTADNITTGKLKSKTEKAEIDLDNETMKLGNGFNYNGSTLSVGSLNVDGTTVTGSLNADNVNITNINGKEIKDGTVIAKALSQEAIVTTSGIKVYYQATQPTITTRTITKDDGTTATIYCDGNGHDYKDGDTWYKTVQVANKPDYLDVVKVFNMSTHTWVEKELDGTIIRANSITAQEIASNTITANEITTSNLSGTNGWINLANGTFAYGKNGQNAISWDGTNLNIGGYAKTDAIPTKVSDLSDSSDYAKSSSIPTKVSQLQNDSSYTTMSSVENKGYQTSNQVNQAITSKGYQTQSDVSSAISTATKDLATKDEVTERVISTDTTVAHIKNVPSGSTHAIVRNIGGLSKKWNQLFDISQCADTKTSNGVTATKSGNGFVVSGTATANLNLQYYLVPLPIGHKFYINGCKGGSLQTYYIGVAGLDLSRDGGDFWTNNTTYDALYFRIDVKSGVTLNNLVIKPLFVDLTAMFGSGNEPTSTSDERIKWIESYASAHPQYDGGSIQSNPIVEVVSKKSDKTTELDKFVIPTESRTKLTNMGYGMGINADVNNGIFFNQTYHNMIGLKLDELTWTSASGVYSATVNGIKANAFVIASDYPNTSITTLDNTIKIATSTTPTGTLHYEATSGGTEYEAIVYHKKVAEVDLGNLTWQRDNSNSSYYYYIATVSDKAVGMYNLLNAIYTTSSSSQGYSRINDKEIIGRSATPPYIYIRDDSITDTTSFKSAMNGVKLQYELATEQIYDVTDFLQSDNIVNCEDGGTLTFIGTDTSKTWGTPSKIEFKYIPTTSITDKLGNDIVAVSNDVVTKTEDAKNNAISESNKYTDTHTTPKYIIDEINQSANTINLNANKINFDGFTTFARSDDIYSSGTTTIDGGKITAESIEVGKLDMDSLQSNIAYIGNKNSEHISIDSNSLDVMNGNDVIASFGSNGINLLLHDESSSGSNNYYEINMTDGIFISAGEEDYATSSINIGYHSASIKASGNRMNPAVVSISGTNGGIETGGGEDQYGLYLLGSGKGVCVLTNLTIGGHDSAVGTTKDNNATSKSVANKTWVGTSNTGLKLESGTWVVDASVTFPSNSTGFRIVKIQYSSDGSSWTDSNFSTNSTQAISGNSTYLHSSTIKYGGDYYFRVVAYQSSGSALSCGFYIRAVRIA